MESKVFLQVNRLSCPTRHSKEIGFCKLNSRWSGSRLAQILHLHHVEAIRVLGWDSKWWRFASTKRGDVLRYDGCGHTTWATSASPSPLVSGDPRGGLKCKARERGVCETVTHWVCCHSFTTPAWVALMCVPGPSDRATLPLDSYPK